jgi:hypothetical protein
MTAKTSPARRAAFMAAVAATGNRTLAAERARVSPSWVTLHRATDPAFRAELDAALATARATLAAQRSARAGMRPAAGLRTAAGEELVVRGGNGRRTQIARARLRQWTPRIEARFVDALAGCCNVRAACAAVGLSVASAYNHRARWHAFAESWDAALATGYARIEAALIHAATAMVRVDQAAGAADEIECVPDLSITGMTVDAAIQLLWLHQKQVKDAGRWPGPRDEKPDIEEVRASILRKIDRIERQAAREKAAGFDAAADRRGLAHGVAVMRAWYAGRDGDDYGGDTARGAG